MYFAVAPEATTSLAEEPVELAEVVSCCEAHTTQHVNTTHWDHQQVRNGCCGEVARWMRCVGADASLAWIRHVHGIPVQRPDGLQLQEE